MSDYYTIKSGPASTVAGTPYIHEVRVSNRIIARTTTHGKKIDGELELLVRRANLGLEAEAAAIRGEAVAS